MNFKLFLLLFLLGCGVKSPPQPPEGIIAPSYTEKYMPNDTAQEKKEDKKQSKTP